MAAVAGQARGDHGAALWMQHWARALRPKGLLVQDYHVVAGHHDHAQGPDRSAHLGVVCRAEPGFGILRASGGRVWLIWLARLTFPQAPTLFGVGSGEIALGRVRGFLGCRSPVRLGTTGTREDDESRFAVFRSRILVMWFQQPAGH